MACHRASQSFYFERRLKKSEEDLVSSKNQLEVSDNRTTMDRQQRDGEERQNPANTSEDKQSELSVSASFSLSSLPSSR